MLQSQRSGIRLKPFRESNLNRYEQILESHSFKTAGLTSIFAGASRFARLTVTACTPGDIARRDVAAGVMGPILTGFLLWVLQRACSLHLSRLYFISRDGEILFQMAQLLIKKLGISIDLRYLYLSRRALNPCAMTSDDDLLWSWVWEETEFLSVDKVLDRVFMTPEEIRGPLEIGGFAETDWRRNLNLRERQTLRCLFEHEEIRQALMRRAVQREKIVSRYLMQEGLTENLSWALVDVGWMGSIQNAMAVVLTNLGKPPPRAFYFGLSKRPDEDRFGQRESYFLDVENRVGFYNEFAGGLVQLLEAFCSGSEGTVVDLMETETKINPVLSQLQNKLVVDWGLPLVQETARRFVDGLELRRGLIKPYSNIKDALYVLFNSFLRAPSIAEAQAWGAIPWEEGPDRIPSVHSLAAPLNLKNIATALMTGSVNYHHRYAWRQGSMALSSPWIRGLSSVIRPYLKVRNLGKQELIR